ncbi:MAG: hypothetical protein RLZZ520_1090 [Bacteroidota bacterium]|jgi:uncharacterized tellurite resistance protein B-like protein
MKTIFSTLLLLTIFSLNATAQKKEEIKVWGNCGMCKKVIETAATGAGATKASWSEETKILSVAYNAKKTDVDKIQQAIVAAGYDTQDFTAPTEVYNKLHGCCQYERKQSAQTTMHQAKMDCCKDGKCEKGKDCQDCKDGKCMKEKACENCKDGKCANGKDCKDCKNCSKH